MVEIRENKKELPGSGRYFDDWWQVILKVVKVSCEFSRDGVEWLI